MRPCGVRDKKIAPAGLDRGGRARRGQGKRWGPEEEGGQAEQGERWQGGAGVGERKPQGFKSSNGFPIDFFRKNCFFGPLPALTYCFSRRNPLRNSSLDRPRKLRNPAWAEKKGFLIDLLTLYCSTILYNTILLRYHTTTVLYYYDTHIEYVSILWKAPGVLRSVIKL